MMRPGEHMRRESFGPSAIGLLSSPSHLLPILLPIFLPIISTYTSCISFSGGLLHPSATVAKVLATAAARTAPS